MKTAHLRAIVDAIRSEEHQLWYVYVLECNDGSHYVGCSSNLEERLKRHNKGYIKYTRNRRPLEMIVYTAFNNKYRAFEYEKYLKTGSGRAFAKRHYFEK